jgi:transglutaminase-like putative cysteine protease
MSRLFIACALLTGCVDAEPDDPTTNTETSAITQAIQHLTIYTIDSTGAHAVPRVGDNYAFRMEFDVATATPQMEIDFTLANLVQKTTFPAVGPGHYVWGAPDDYGDFGPMSLDGFINFTAVIGVNSEINGNPPTTNNGRIMLAGFTPTAPASEVEYFDQRELTGYNYATIRTTPGAELLYMAAGTTGADGQSTISNTLTTCDSNGCNSNHATVSDANPNKYPVFIYDGQARGNTITFAEDFDITVSNQRVDMDKLRAITWDDYANDVANNAVHAYYTQPESVVQSTDPQIVAFVNSILGVNYKFWYTPYDAARKLFAAVVARSTYVLPPGPGEVDQRAQSAVDMLNHPKGDCGSFSMLVTAVFRALGLPARTTAGAWIGDGIGHAWTELYIPGANEWIIADGSGAKFLDPTANYVYLFGAAVDRNQRMTQSRGNTFTAPAPHTGYTDHWLQGPALWMLSGSIEYQSWESHVQEASHLALPK